MEKNKKWGFFFTCTVPDTFDIFEDSSLQSVWSMDLFDPFPCYLHHIAFDRLKSHTPFPCPASQLIYIFLKFQCVLCILNFSEANTVLCKESYFRISVCWDIINVQRKQQETKDSALWDTRQNRSPIRFCSVYNNCLLSVEQKKSIHFSAFPPMPQPNSLLLRSLGGGVLNAFSKSKMNVINLSSIVQDFSPIITVVSWVSQMCLFLNACCLSEKFIFHPDEPWCSNTLHVQITCKVHKSVRQDDKYMWEPCYPFYGGYIYLQETILWGFHPCQEGQKRDPVQLQAPLGL